MVTILPGRDNNAWTNPGFAKLPARAIKRVR
jgi:hypothetical protein